MKTRCNWFCDYDHCEKVSKPELKKLLLSRLPENKGFVRCAIKGSNPLGFAAVRGRLTACLSLEYEGEEAILCTSANRQLLNERGIDLLILRRGSPEC